MSVILLPWAAEHAATAPAPDLVPLLEQLATLRREHAVLRAENAVLQARVHALEARLMQHAAHSPRPLTSDSPEAPMRPTAPPTGRTRGGQSGPRGAFHALLPVAQVDEVVVVLREACRHGGQRLPAPAGGRRGRTCRQRGRRLLHFLVAAGEAALEGRPQPSRLPAPAGY
jgi:hypothetical protein